MRERNLLHIKHLERFKVFCQDLGWKEEKTKGLFEVLRMRHRLAKEPLIVHQKRIAKEHLTTWGESESLARLFYSKNVRRD